MSGLEIENIYYFVQLLQASWQVVSGVFLTCIRLLQATGDDDFDSAGNLWIEQHNPLIPTTTPAHPLHSTVITSKHRREEVMECLVTHGCRDVTLDLDPTTDSKDIIAYGGFGIIYSGRLRDGTPIAIKCIKLTTNQIQIDKNFTSNLKHTARELHTWSKCDHPGVLPLLGMARFRGCIAMVSPLMPAGQLDRYIAQNPSTNRIDLSAQLAGALGYLHAQGITHGDIKAANILISKDGRLKVADFGNAVVSPSTLEITPMSSCCSIRWGAPEILNSRDSINTAPADVYALGMTILEILTGQIPYADKNERGVVLAVLRKELPPRAQFGFLMGDEQLGNDLWLLLMRCWEYEPEDRPTAVQVKNELVEIESRVKRITRS